MKAEHRFLNQTKRLFLFLVPLGFRVQSEHEGTYASFKDGFDITYNSGDVTVRVAYYDMELEIIFRRGAVAASYLCLDQNLRANASGLAGNMFPFEKLSPVLDHLAKDIETNYVAILRGDAVIWQKIEKLVSAPKEKKPFLP